MEIWAQDVVGADVASREAVAFVTNTALCIMAGRHIVLHDVETRHSAFVGCARPGYIPNALFLSPTLTHVAVVEVREDLVEGIGKGARGHHPPSLISVHPLSRALHRLAEQAEADESEGSGRVVAPGEAPRAVGPASARVLSCTSIPGPPGAFRGRFTQVSFSSEGSFLAAYGEEEGREDAALDDGGPPARVLVVWRWPVGTVVASACPKERVFRLRVRPFPFGAAPFGASDGSASVVSHNPAVLSAALVLTGTGPGLARQWRPTPDRGLRAGSLVSSRRVTENVVDHSWVWWRPIGGGKRAQQMLLLMGDDHVTVLQPRDTIGEEGEAARAAAAAAAALGFVPLEVTDTLQLGAPASVDSGGVEEAPGAAGLGHEGHSGGNDALPSTRALLRQLSEASTLDAAGAEMGGLAELSSLGVHAGVLSAFNGGFAVGGSRGFVAAYVVDEDGDADAGEESHPPGSGGRFFRRSFAVLPRNAAVAPRGDGTVDAQGAGSSGGLADLSSGGADAHGHDEDDAATLRSPVDVTSLSVDPTGKMAAAAGNGEPSLRWRGASSDEDDDSLKETAKKHHSLFSEASTSSTTTTKKHAKKHSNRGAVWTLPVGGPDAAAMGAAAAEARAAGSDPAADGGGASLPPQWGDGAAVTEDVGTPLFDRGAPEAAVVGADAAVTAPLVLAAAADGVVRVVHLLSGRVELTLDVGGADPTESPTAVAMHPSGTLAAIATPHLLRLFHVCAASRHLRPWTEVRTSRAVSWRNTAVVRFSPDGGRLAVAAGPHASVVDVWTGAVVADLVGHVAPITALAWAADGSALATAGEDGALYMWDPRSGTRDELGSAVLKGVRFEAVALLPAAGRTGIDVSAAEQVLSRRTSDSASKPTPQQSQSQSQQQQQSTRSSSPINNPANSHSGGSASSKSWVVVGAGCAVDETVRRKAKEARRLRDDGPSDQRVCLLALVANGDVTKVATGGRQDDEAAMRLGGVRSVRITSLAPAPNGSGLFMGTEFGSVRAVQWPLQTKLSHGWTPEDSAGVLHTPTAPSPGGISPSPLASRPHGVPEAPVSSTAAAAAAAAASSSSASSRVAGRHRSFGTLLRSGDAAVGSVNAVRLGALPSPPFREVPLHSNRVTSLSTAAQGRILLSAGQDGCIFLSALPTRTNTESTDATLPPVPLSTSTSKTPKKSRAMVDALPQPGTQRPPAQTSSNPSASSPASSDASAHDITEEDLDKKGATDHDHDHDEDATKARDADTYGHRSSNSGWEWSRPTAWDFVHGVAMAETSALAEARRRAAQLRDELQESRADAEKQRRLQERQLQEAARRKEKESSERLREAEARAESLTRRADELAREAAAAQRALESTHDRTLRAREAEYERRLGREIRRFDALDEELERLRQEQAAAEERHAHEMQEAVSNARARGEMRERELEARVERLEDELRRARQTSEVVLRDTEMEYEQELANTKTSGKLEVEAERRTAAERAGRAAALRKRLLAYKHQAESAEERAHALYIETEELNRAVRQRDEALASQAREREAAQVQLEKWQAMVAELRSDLSTMRNHRFVLEHKVEEMAKERAPLAEHASKLEGKVRSMYHELLGQVDAAKMTEREKEAMRMARNALAAENANARKAVQEAQQKVSAILRDIELMSSAEDSEIVDAARALYQKYVRGGGTKGRAGHKGSKGAAVLAAAEAELRRALGSTAEGSGPGFDLGARDKDADRQQHQSASTPGKHGSLATPSKADAFPAGREVMEQHGLSPKGGRAKPSPAAASTYNSRFHSRRNAVDATIASPSKKLTVSTTSSSKRADASAPVSATSSSGEDRRSDDGRHSVDHHRAHASRSADGLVPASVAAEALSELQRQRDYVLHGAVARDVQLKSRRKEGHRREQRAMQDNAQLVAECNRLRAIVKSKDETVKRLREELFQAKQPSSTSTLAKQHLPSPVPTPKDNVVLVTAPQASNTAADYSPASSAFGSMVNESQLAPEPTASSILPPVHSAESLEIQHARGQNQLSVAHVPLHRGKRADAMGSLAKRGVTRKPAAVSVSASEPLLSPIRSKDRLDDDQRVPSRSPRAWNTSKEDADSPPYTESTTSHLSPSLRKAHKQLRKADRAIATIKAESKQ